MPSLFIDSHIKCFTLDAPQLVREVLSMLKTRLAGRLSLSRAEFRTKSDPRLAQIKKKSISHCCNFSFVCGCGYFFASCSLRDSLLPPRVLTQKVLWLESGVVQSDYQQFFVPTWFLFVCTSCAIQVSVFECWCLHRPHSFYPSFYTAAMGHNVTNQCPSSNPVLPPTLSAS